MEQHNTFILGSASPRRARLLEEAGYRFEAVAPLIDESRFKMPAGLAPGAVAESLAYLKARSVAGAYPGRRILSADTIVTRDGVILGKPADKAAAAAMLETVSSAPHTVITGVALLEDDDRRLISSAKTVVTMRPMSREEIEGYLATGEWRGKAGAYAIQETADRFVETLDGSFSNVVGLPMELVGDMMEAMDAACEAGADGGGR